MKKMVYNNLDEAPDENNYSSKPVQNYGLSLLKNMGFSEERGIGKNNKQKTEILVLKPRPKGLGLGAQNQDKQKEQMFQKGDSVKIKEGPHSNMIGHITEITKDDFTVSLYPSESSVKIKKNKLELMSSEQEEKWRQQYEKKIERNEKKLKKLKWILPQIRIKVIDKESKYYLKKVIVTQILSQKQFECRDELGNYVDNFRQKQVQTVIPKIGSTVLIVKGYNKGQKAHLQERKKQKGQVWVKTLEQLEIIELDENDICQYVQL